MKVKGKMLLSLVLMGFVVAGCGKSGSRSGEQVQSPVEAVVSKALQKVESGDVNAALAILEKGLVELADPSDKGQVFSFELTMLLNQGRVEDAQARYLKALATETESGLARHAMGVVENYWVQQPGGQSNVLAWCDRLEQVAMSEDMKTVVLQNRLTAQLALGRYDDALVLIETRAWPLADELVGAMCGRYIQSALSAGRADDALAVIGLLEVKGAARPGLVALAAGSRIDLALAQGRFVAAGELLFEKAVVFDDGASAGILDKIARVALGTGKSEEADQVVGKALSALADRPGTRSSAARWWLMRARDLGNLDLAVDRLVKLDGMGLPTSVLAAGVNTVCSLVLAPETPLPAVTRMMGFVGGLKARVTEEMDVALLAGVQLDGGFRTEDYAGLVTVLEGGVPGHDSAWHDTMINKVKAHLALKEGRIDEAVKRFRDFMASIAAQPDQGHRDPVTEERVSKPMILGYNARRIGDILAAAKRMDDAAKAYAEAKAYYQDSLKGFVENDPETKTVKTILAELDKGSGGV